MKLRNKQTGEIKDLDIRLVGTEPDRFVNSLAELNEKWEDYEEPKEYWYIDAFGNIVQNKITKHRGDAYTDMTDLYETQKQIGNYFETKEEAEKAVKKLKAWKRLKDKGFKFEGWDNTDRSTIHNFSLFVAIEDLESINKDLDLLFGGEE